MNLTVTARIVGGAGLVILLLTLLVFNSLSGVSSINDSLVSVTEQSTPMLEGESQTVQSLLHAAAEVNYYHQSSNLKDLADLESRYQAQMQSNSKATNHLSELASTFPDILSPLNESKKKIGEYLKIVPQSFASHKTDLSLGEQVEDKRGSFEDAADELGSLLFDFADSASNKTHVDTLKSLARMVEEATITVTDVLSVDSADQVAVAKNDISSLVADFEGKFKRISDSSIARTNEYYADTISTIETFEVMIVGDSSILDKFESQLKAREQAKSQLSRSGVVLSEALANLKKVSSAVKDLTNRIKEEANDSVSSSTNVIISFAIIAILVAIGINFWVLQSIRKPLSEVLRVMTKVSSGDLRETVQVHSSDEIGKLSEGFNQVISQLSGMLNEISSSSQQLSAAAEETSAISSQSHENINRQKEQTDMIATAMTEMTATVDEVASSAKNSSEEVGKADKEANDGQIIVHRSIDSINDLSEEIKKAAAVIDKLDQYSSNIGSVLDVIRGIADQTNLLALNAAIEAARAGEQGRGFAVVADEVRSLASKTQESTSEIQEMIERLQSGTQEAVQVMKSSTEEAQNSVSETAKAGESLTKITQAVKIINDMSAHIANAANEQSTVSREMHENVLAISQSADQTAQGASENLAASQEMATLAENLQQLVGRFKF